MDELEKRSEGSVSLEPGLESRVLLMKDFDEVAAGKAYRDFFDEVGHDNEDARMYVYTPAHIGSKSAHGLFSDFAPSIVYACNRHNGTHLPYREKTLNEFASSKLSHGYCTQDRSIIHGFFNRHMAKSKVYNLNSIATIFHRPDLLLDETPLDNKDISREDLLHLLFQVKKNSTKLFSEVHPPLMESKTFSEELHNFSYPKVVESILGRNLKKILLYGSSARGEGSDYDNIGVIDHLGPELYERIYNTKLSEKGKDVGFIFVPENILEKFLYINVSNGLFREHSKALKGDFSFPIESERYAIWKEMYHAAFGSGKLISSMNLVFREPEILYDKEGLFEYFMKLNRFTLHGLLQKDGRVLPSKEELVEILRDDYDYEVPAFRPDATYLQECFLKANKASVAIAKNIFDPSLAREENEHLLMLKRQHARKIFEASHKGRRVYVFGGREPLHEGDAVPVKVLTGSDEGYGTKMREIFHRDIDKGREFLVGKRV